MTQIRWLLLLLCAPAFAQPLPPRGVAYGLEADKTIISTPIVRSGPAGMHLYGYTRDDAGNVYAPSRSCVKASCPTPSAFLTKLLGLQDATAYLGADVAAGMKPCDAEARKQCTSFGAMCRELRGFVIADWPVGKPVWKPLVREGAAFTATGRVRYGAGTAWVEKVAAGDGACTNAFFGSDPAQGVVKACEVLTGDLKPAPAPETAPVCQVPTYTHTVKPNGTSLTRPAYTLVNGVRGSVSIGRANVGQPCDLTKPTLASGADVWASFGPTPEAGKVALCAKTTN